jgi:hypothetical protein
LWVLYKKPKYLAVFQAKQVIRKAGLTFRFRMNGIMTGTSNTLMLSSIEALLSNKLAALFTFEGEQINKIKFTQ